MFDSLAARISEVVTRRPVSVIILVLLLTAGVALGLPQLDIEDQTDIDDGVFEVTEVGEALSYNDAHYGDDDEDETAVSSVYLRSGENTLSRSSLITALEYQESVLNDETVRSELIDGQAIRGPPTYVGQELVGDDANTGEMKIAIERASDDELAAAVKEVFSNPERAGQHLPRGYEPSTAEAESMRLFFEFEQAEFTQQQEPLPDADAQQTLYETAQEEDDIFTMGTFAQEKWDEQQIIDTFWLVVPAALLLVIGVLIFAYRDPVDVVLGFTGVCVSLVWFFGILGWLGVPAGFASIVGPILIVALSIDFGLHVFMRYREQREKFRGSDSGPDNTINKQADSRGTNQTDASITCKTSDKIRSSMYRSSRSVLVAFLLVAVTAGAGFLANITNPIGFIRAFGIVITLGVLASVFVFATLVPALKVIADSLLERWGLDRHRTALGTTGLLKRFLSSGVTLARHGAIIVLVVAVVAGGLGLVAYTDLDRQGFQQDFTQEDDWQTSLPGPVGWSAHETEYRTHLDYVESQYQSDDERERNTIFLIRGDVTDAKVLERIHTGTALTEKNDMTFEQGGEVAIVSPLSLIQKHTIESEEFANLVAGVAEEDEQFADVLKELGEENAQFDTALARAEPAKAENLTTVYDALYESASAEASAVIERTGGEYESMQILVPVNQDVDIDERGTAMHEIADGIEGETELHVVPVDFATVSNAGLGEIADSILWTMLLAFAGVTVVLGVAYRIERESLTLGAVTVAPIMIVVGFVFGGMYLFSVSLTFITAFLVSITIGLGIDYNIHISDRFAQEFERTGNPEESLYIAVRGTGGALLGSALTSSAAFATLLVHPSVVFQSFGLIVVLALLLSFFVSIFVLPSFLLLWARWQPVTRDRTGTDVDAH